MGQLLVVGYFCGGLILFAVLCMLCLLLISLRGVLGVWVVWCFDLLLFIDAFAWVVLVCAGFVCW